MLGLGFVTIEWALGALTGLVPASIAIVTFWLKFSDRISRADAKAEAAQMAADEAKKDADLLSTQFAAHIGTFAIYREYVAREYVDRDWLAATETRIMDGIKSLEKRIDQVRIGGK